METGLKLCREFLAKYEPLNSDALFAERIERFRQGEELAGSEISGSYLGQVIDLVESLATLPRNLELLDAIQEANVGLVDAIHTFKGSTADEFWQHAQRTILNWLNSCEDT